MATPNARDHERLARLAKSRRAELGLALNDKNATAGGLSNRTWQRVEKGLPIRDTNYRKVDALLHWARGSCLRILDGGEPVSVEDIRDPEAAGVQKSTVPQDVIDKRALDTVQLALLATAKGMSAEDIRESSERVLRDLREGGLI